jgi:cation diffusion facilitator CzcD-associated flavoprotein CzcO
MKEVWRDGVWTYLGMMTAGFPNMFMTYSPQGKPSLRSDSPSKPCH